MKKTRTKFLHLLFCFLILSATALLFSENISAQEIKILKVPQQNFALNKNQRIPPRPRALRQAEKIQIAQQILGAKSQKITSMGSNITLNMENISLGDTALLSFANPIQVRGGSQGFASFPANLSGGSSGGMLFLSFAPPLAGKYLIDITAESVGPPMKFTLYAQENTLTAVGKQSDTQHLPVIVEAKQANELIMLNLSADGNWFFYSCEISQIK